MIPVFLSTVPRKLIASFDFSTIPSTFPETKNFHRVSSSIICDNDFRFTPTPLEFFR